MPAMWAETYENWETLFPEEVKSQTSDAETLFLGLMFFILDDCQVETVIQRTSVERNKTSMFRPEQGVYGKSLRNRTGEEVWIRMRSFLDHVALPNRAFENMAPGEIREVVVVIGTKCEADVTIIRSWRAPDPACCSKPLSPKFVQTKTHAVYGCGVLPFLIPESHNPNKKKCKSLQMYKYKFLFHTSADVPGANGETTITRGMSAFTLSEWVMECRLLRYPKEGPFALSYELNEWTGHLNRFLHNTSEKQSIYNDGHQVDDGLPLQTVKSYDRALSMANKYMEMISLASLIDMAGSGCMNGLPHRLFSLPHLFPLYASVAIVIAANPQYFFPKSHSLTYAEDLFLINQLYLQYTSLHKQTTPLELLVHEVSIQMSRIVSRERAKQKTKMEPGESRVPVGLEGMRRQALSLAHELFSSTPECTQKQRLSETTSFFPPELVADAVDNLSSNVQHRADVERLSCGFRGCNNPTEPRSLRTSSRDSMARIALQTLLDVNEYISTGVFRMQKLTEDSDIVRIVEAGVQVDVNLEAWEETKSIVKIYFAKGSTFLVESCKVMNFPCRPRTRIQCGGCLDSRSPLEMAASHLCCVCHAHLCVRCSKTIHTSFCRNCVAATSTAGMRDVTEATDATNAATDAEKSTSHSR